MNPISACRRVDFDGNYSLPHGGVDAAAARDLLIAALEDTPARDQDEVLTKLHVAQAIAQVSLAIKDATTDPVQQASRSASLLRAVVDTLTTEELSSGKSSQVEETVRSLKSNRKR